MARRSLRRARSIGAETRSVAAPACAIAVVLAVAIAAARGSAAPARAQGDGPRFEGITVLADGHHAFARLAGRDESAPSLWVEAAILPPVIDSLIDCAPPACDPDAPRATAHAQTVPDGSLEFTFVTAGPFQRRPVRFAPGDRLRLRALGERVEAVTTVAPLVVAPVDAAADRLSGTGPAGARLSITANRPDGAFAFSQATVDADGRWSADLAGTLDLVPGAFGAVSTIVDGTTTQASWSVPRAFVRLGDPVIDVYARSGDGADVYQSCAGNGTENDHLGRAVVWRGASEATPLLLRDRSGALAAPGALNCYELTFAIGGLPQPVPVALDNDVEIDTVADEVRSKGSWPAGRYRVEAGGVTRVVEVTALSSTLSVPLDGVVDLTSTLPVDVATADDTATIGWSLRAYPLSIDDIDPTIVRVRGRGTAGRYVVVTIGDDDHASGAAVIGPDGTFDAIVRYAASRAPVPLDDATVIQVSDVVEPRLGPGDVPQPVPETVTFVAAPLHARALANRDLVEGTARPGAHIQVRAGSERDPHIVDTLAAASNGEWSADFTDITDLVPGTPITVEAITADGYRSTLTFPVVRASAQVGGDRVIIEGHPGLKTEVEVSREGMLIASAACNIADDATACTARVRDTVTNSDTLRLPTRMRGGDEVVVLPDAGGSATLQLIDLTAHIDATAKSVVGACPPNGEMRVVFHAPEDAIAPFNASTSADGNGVCDYELSRGEWDLLVPGVSADLIHTLPGGHQIFATGAYEQVRLINNGPFEGLAEPFNVVTLTLRSAAGVDRRLFSVRADGAGHWTSALNGAGDRTAHRPEPGGLLLVDDGRKHHALPYTPLVAWWDDPLGAVVGLTNPDQPVRVVHDVTETPCSPWSMPRPDVAVVTDTADPFGTFAFGAPPVDACALGRAEVVAPLGSGDEVRFVVGGVDGMASVGGRVYLPLGGR